MGRILCRMGENALAYQSEIALRLVDDNWIVRQHAVRYFAIFGSQADPDLIEKALRLQTDEEEEVCMTVNEAIAKGLLSTPDRVKEDNNSFDSLVNAQLVT